MIVVWKDKRQDEAIVYREQSSSKMVDGATARQLIRDWDPTDQDEHLVEGYHLEAFDGPWPVKEVYNAR